MKIRIYMAHGAPPIVMDKITPEGFRGLSNALSIALQENRTLVLTSATSADHVINPAHVVAIVPF
jgi:hypothetical protein